MCKQYTRPMADSTTLLEKCLYFTANALARNITRMAEDSFAPAGLTPSQAFMLMLVLESPGVTPSELAASLHLAPSTVTRLADSLLRKGLVERTASGKTAHYSPTQAAHDARPTIDRCWKSLHQAYSALLGEADGDALSHSLLCAGRLLEPPR